MLQLLKEEAVFNFNYSSSYILKELRILNVQSNVMKHKPEFMNRL